METLTPAALAYCSVVLLFAYGLRGSTGFGGAVGMPLLALVVPLKVLVPLWTLLGISSSITIVGRERQFVDLKAVMPFAPWCLLGIAAGLYFFKTLDAAILSRALGVLIVLYALYALHGTYRKRDGTKPPALLAPLAAGTSGFVGALFGTLATVFFAIYLDTRELAKAAFRATMSAMLLTLSVVRGIGYYAVGEFTHEVWYAFAAALPMMLIGIWIGDRVHMNISELSFKRLICAILFLCGILLLIR